MTNHSIHGSLRSTNITPKYDIGLAYTPPTQAVYLPTDSRLTNGFNQSITPYEPSTVFIGAKTIQDPPPLYSNTNLENMSSGKQPDKIFYRANTFKPKSYYSFF